MSLPGVEELIEKLLPKILGRLGKENPSRRQCKVAFVQRKCAVMSSVSVRFLYAPYNQSSKISVCMQGSRECCPEWCTHSGTIYPSSYGSPVRYQVLRDVTRHFNRPFRNLPGFEHRRVIHQKSFSGVALSY